MSQVDTFSLNNMPGNYYLGNWLEYDYFRNPFYYEDGTVGGMNYTAEVPFCVGGFPFWEYGYEGALSRNFWNESHILNFAAGKYADTTIRVAGVALFYPRYYSGGSVAGCQEWHLGFDWGYRIIDSLVDRGFDHVSLQLMDSNMNVLAEGSTPLTDTMGRPVFVINKYRQNEVTSGAGDVYSYTHDVFEVYFNTPVTISDSFYLSCRFESTTNTKEYGFSVPVILEYKPQPNSTSPYYFPGFTWKALGGYKVVYDEEHHSVVRETVADTEWFSLENCFENHGYILIFPILEVVCGVPENVTFNPMGGSNVMLRWGHGEWETAWEVSYGAEGTPPGEGTVVETDRPSVMLNGIVMGEKYVAYVRSRCTVRDTMWSEWSDSVTIALSNHQGVDDVEAEGIRIYAEEGRIVVEGTTDEVRVYDMKGSQTSDRDLPAGVYMVKVGDRPARRVVVVR